MRYCVLGSTQVLCPDGTALAVGGARLRALLTVLVLRAGRTVSVGSLVEEVWAGEPPADAQGALQALVGRLRRTLGAEAIVSVDGGYRLAVGSDDVDVFRFERLAGDGVRALADGDPAKAAVLLEDALALWRGPALADLPDRSAEAARWEMRRLDAVRARHTAALALGRAEQILPELTALCDSHPLDEPLQSLRLRALRDAGRTAEALAAYDEVRSLLADRLGTDPGAELRALHLELLNPTPVVRSVVSPSPASGGAAPGDGPATSPHPSHSGTPDDHQPPPPPGNLRARLTSFVGREADIETIRGDLATARLVTLLGPGGAGKTRLSQEAAETVAARDGVWLAELAPVSDPSAVPQAVVTAVGARETVLYGAGAEEFRAAGERHDDPVERLVDHCSRRRMLIILDNCEHVVEAAAHLAEELLARCPELTILATSREPLGVPGELLRPVEPLPEPVALRLLTDRGAAARPGFRTADDPGACAEICRRLDGLPLAIELAAARLRILTPRQIADRLDDRFRLLTSGSRTVLPRQQTLRAVVDWSWELLDEDERDVLGRLSVFAGGCDLPAAEAVCGPAALEGLGSLVDKSLVVAAPSPDGAMRYRLLETVAEYAGERLTQAGARADAERAHLTYYRELARTSEPSLRGPRQLTAIQRFQAEYENLRTALRHAVDAPDEQEALSLAHSLLWYWQMRDMRIEARNWFKEVMELGPDPFAGPEPHPAGPVWERVTAQPPPFTGEFLAEARRGAHLTHLAYMDTELELWQTPEAERRLTLIKDTYHPGLPQLCWIPGLHAFYAVMLSGDIEMVRDVLHANIEICRAHPALEWDLAFCLQLRGNFLANRSDWAGDGARDADEALDIFRRHGDSWGAAESLSARAEAHERLGFHEKAAADYREAMVHAERLGARAQLTILRVRFGNVLLEGGDLAEKAEGEAILREAITDAESYVNEARPAARLFLAAWLGETGRRDEARDQLRQLREDFALAQFLVFDAFIDGVEAWLDACDGEVERALITVRRALTASGAPLSLVIAPHMRALYLCTAAFILTCTEDPDRAADAARCLGASDAMLPPGHIALRQERMQRTDAETRARRLLGDTAYEAAYAQGGGLGYEEAAALV